MVAMVAAEMAAAATVPGALGVGGMAEGREVAGMEASTAVWEETEVARAEKGDAAEVVRVTASLVDTGVADSVAAVTVVE